MSNTTTHKSHSELAEKFNRDEARVDWHNETLWWIRQKRDKAAWSLGDEWEPLREQASNIKAHTLSRLSEYLTEFEKNALANGAIIHWAADGDEHNRIVEEILSSHKVKQLVKSKSMLTEECKLNEYLKEKGFDVIDTDLGERIVQLAEEAPSHIVLPCIHWKKEEIGELFHKHLGSPEGVIDPSFLTHTARLHLREKFLTRKVAITGVNFAVAETGEFVVCTNEGNADMGTHLADVHIACMGIEKLIPKREHLGVFLRLLTRSATGQPITTYSSHYKKPKAGQELHIVLVDNGRSKQLGRDNFRNSLKCIRCGACFNTCPVYRRSGGHSYRNAIAGPIGSILAPNLDMREYKDLPFASTLCGSCTNVCPVKINIHEQLYLWRQVLTEEGYQPKTKTAAMKVMAATLSKPRLFSIGGKWARKVMKIMPGLMNNRFNPWYKERDMPAPPAESFTEWYKKNRKK